MATPTSQNSQSNSNDPYAKYADPYAKYADQAGPTGVQAVARHGLTKLLAPMAGGIVGVGPGAMGGAALGTMVAPGPGTVIGGILGGMAGAGAGTAGAEAGREALAGQGMDPREIATQGAISAVTEPLGMLIGPGVKGVKALRGSEGLGAAGKKFLGGVSKEIEDRFPGATAQVEKLGVGHRGLGQIEKQISAVDATHKAIVHQATQAGVRATPLDLIHHVMNVVNELDTAGSGKANIIIRKANAFFDNLGPSGTYKLTPDRVLKIKQAAQDAADALYESQGMRKAAGKTLKRVGGKTAELNFQEALAKGAKDWLEQNVKGSAKLNAESRALQGARRALKGPASKLARRSVSRVATAATTAALPGGLATHGLAGLLGYHVGQYAEPLVTPMVGGVLGALQSQAGQQIIGQIPRGLGLLGNQAFNQQEQP